MSKFKVFASRTHHYEMEIEAKTANEAEEIYWDSDNIGEPIEDSGEITIEEIHDSEGNLVTNWDKEY